MRAVDVGVIRGSTTEKPTHSDDAGDRWWRDRISAFALKGTESQTAERLFCCIGGVGFDSETNRRANALPSWIRAHGGYVLAAARTLMTWQPVDMRVELPEKGVTLDEPASFVVFANAPSYGDGMRIAPHAALDDGLLDVCFVRGTSKGRIVSNFASIYSGSHLKLREVEYHQVSRLRVHTARPLDVYADGEYMCGTPVDVRVRRKAFKVIC